MPQDLSTARYHLEEAHRLLQGDDDLQLRSRQAIEILIDALLSAEFAAPNGEAEIITFPKKRVRP